MMDEPTNKKKKANTKEMIYFAIYACLIKKSYSQISVKEICEKAKISRMSFYRYFSDKEDVFVNMLDSKFEMFFNNFQVIENPSLSDIFISVFEFIKPYSEKLKVYKNAGLQYVLLNQFNSYVRYTLSNTKSNRMPKISECSKIVVPFLAGGIFMIIFDWIERGLIESPKEVNTLFLNFMTKITEAIKDDYILPLSE